MKAANKNYKTTYKGYEITFAGGIYFSSSMVGRNLREIKKKIRLKIAEPKFEMLKDMGIMLGDVVGGKMWHDNNTGRWSWNVSDFAKGFSELNEFTFNINN